MGSGLSTKKKTSVQQTFNYQRDFTCQDDEQCMNIDQNRSTLDFGSGKGPTLVYACPDAKCVQGECECGSDCKLDPYTKVCCQDVIKEGDIDICVEFKGEPLDLKNISRKPYIE